MPDHVHLYIPAYLLYAWQAVAYLDSGVGGVRTLTWALLMNPRPLITTH